MKPSLTPDELLALDHLAYGFIKTFEKHNSPTVQSRIELLRSARRKFAESMCEHCRQRERRGKSSLCKRCQDYQRTYGRLPSGTTLTRTTSREKTRAGAPPARPTTSSRPGKQR